MKQTFFCVHCGASLPEGAESCTVCGQRQLPPVPAPTARSRLAMRLLPALSLRLSAATVPRRHLFCGYTRSPALPTAAGIY